jgi:Na+/proline symporter
VGATARLYLVINILYVFILKDLGISFGLTTGVILMMILLYTFEGGVKTIVYTDTLQTTCMLLGLVVCIVYIMQHLGLSAGGVADALEARGLSRIFHTDVNSKNFFPKQIVGGMFIAIAMTGLDQEMMQKNISVRNLRDSKKNMVVFTFVFALVSFLFLLLGGLLYLFAAKQGGVNVVGDGLFPTLALHYLPRAVSIIFIIALISALFPSADGALTALTSSFCIDMLDLQGRQGMSERRKRRVRLAVHVSFAVVFLLCILVFKWVNNPSTIGVILDLAGYTYGPLLGLFSFGIFTRRALPNTWMVTAWCLVAPAICWVVSRYSAGWFGGYQIGIELLLLNGLLTFAGLAAMSGRPTFAKASAGEGV